MSPHSKHLGNRLRLPSVVLSFFLLTSSGWTQPSSDKGPSFQVGGLQIEVDPRLRDNWVFSDFRQVNLGTRMRILGVATYLGGKPLLDRWYGYDKNGVKIDEGPLGYQDYPPKEKTLFEILPGQNWQQIKRIRLAAPAEFPPLPPAPEKRLED